MVQASDGDNWPSDNDACMEQLAKLMPLVQYYVYAEVKTYNPMFHTTGLWDLMEEQKPIYSQLAVVSIPSVAQVVPVFRQVFAKEKANG